MLSEITNFWEVFDESCHEKILEIVSNYEQYPPDVINLLVKIFIQ